MTGAFRFGADEDGLDEATRLDGGAGPVDFDRRANPGDQESTRVVAAPGQRPMARPAAQAAWRIKGERGLVYEMQSVNAVVAWLEGKREIRSIQIAKGDGPFRPVDQYPEVEARLQKRPDAGAPVLATSGGADEPLTLDLSTQPRRSPEATTRPARPAEAEAARAGRTREASAPKGPVEVEATSGFGLVLAAVLGSLALTVGAIAVGVLVGDLAPPAPVEVAAARTFPAPAGELAQAIAEYEAGHNTAASKILEGLRGADDPRVDRYLALVLHRSGRDREARAALDRYRAAMLRVNGEHGRQVREVRD
ncbi:MAG: hypothetical protein KC613_03545 [Myxococcales bacterium]|nr:hypothetical protein [Myxococcales bacterium]MCB9524986.1 hypothetical protein [Myxococcales bacterium]